MADTVVQPNNQLIRYRGGKGKPMAKLDAAERNALPADKFAEPAERKYPVPDASHAANAKARAKQMLKKGEISDAEYAKIVAKADAVEGKTEKAAPTARDDEEQDDGDHEYR